MPLEFQTALPPHVFGIPVQETPPLPRNSKMPPVVWYGYFLESPIVSLNEVILYDTPLKVTVDHAQLVFFSDQDCIKWPPVLAASCSSPEGGRYIIQV